MSKTKTAAITIVLAVLLACAVTVTGVLEGRKVPRLGFTIASVTEDDQQPTTDTDTDTEEKQPVTVVAYVHKHHAGRISSSRLVEDAVYFCFLSRDPVSIPKTQHVSARFNRGQWVSSVHRPCVGVGS